MAQQLRVSGVLIERIGEAASVLEQTVGWAIDEAEQSGIEEVGVVESFEVIEATLMYHRRSGLGPAACMRSPRFEDSSVVKVPRSDRLECAWCYGVTGESRVRTSSIAERVIECGTRLHALTLMYGLLQCIANDEGSRELAARAELYRRDLVELGDEIERCLFGRTSLTGVINASNGLG